MIGTLAAAIIETLAAAFGGAWRMVAWERVGRALSTLSHGRGTGKGWSAHDLRCLARIQGV